MSTFDIKRLSKPMLADYQDYAKTGEDAIYWLVASRQLHTTDQIITRMQSSTVERTTFSGLKTLGEWTSSQYGPTQIRATLAPMSNTNKYSSFALVERSIQLGKLRYPLRHSFAATKPAFVKKTYATYTSMLRAIKQQYGIDVVETARFDEMFRYTHSAKFGGLIKNVLPFSRTATPDQRLSERKKLDYAGTIYLNNNLRLASGIQYEISQQEKMTKIFDAIFEVSINQYAKEKPELALSNDEKFVARLIADVLMSRAIDFGDAEDNINAEASLTLQLSNVLAYLDLSPERLRFCGRVGLECTQDACKKMGLDINKIMQGMTSANHTYKKSPQTLAEALAPINKPLDITFEAVDEKPEPVVPKKPSPIDELSELLDSSKEDKEREQLAQRLARLIQRVSDKKQEQDQQDEQKRKEEEARKKAEEEARRQEEERRKQEEAARIAAEEEARRQEEERRKQEELERQRAEEEARRKAAEEEARKKAEEERIAREKQLEEEAKRLAEERKKLEQEQARLKAEEEARKKAEAEAKRKAEEEAKRLAEEKRKQEEAARIAAEAEAKRRAEEEERRKQEDAKKEEERKRLEEENRRLREEEEARKKAEEEEAKKKIGKKSVLFGIKDKVYLKRKSAADYFDKIILKSISSATDSIVKSRYAPNTSKKKAELLDRQYNFLDHMMSFYNKNKLTGNAEQIERELTSEHGIADNNVAHAFANAFIELREHILDQIFAQEDKIEKPDGKSIATIINECVEEKFGSKLSTFVNDQIKREIKEIFKQIDMNAYKATSFIDDDNSLDTSSHNQSE